MPIKFIVGLGNPGDKYQDTRHNIGFRTVDRFLEAEDAEAIREKFPGGYSLLVSLKTHPYRFFKPTSFMNRSGGPVTRAARQWEYLPEETLIIHDEIDLDEGRLQIKKGGGTAGHKGIHSIAQEWGTDAFYRLRVGVGRGAGDPADYILQEVPPDVLNAIAEPAVKALQKILELGPDAAMNFVNRKND